MLGIPMDVAISVALAIAVSALTAVVDTVSVTFSAAVFAFAVRAERSTWIWRRRSGGSFTLP